MSALHEDRYDPVLSPQEHARQRQRTVAAARHALRGSPYLPLRGLHCDYCGETLVIRGRVPTFYLKQLAQSVICRLPGVVQVSNRVDVVPPGSSSPAEEESVGDTLSPLAAPLRRPK